MKNKKIRMPLRWLSLILSLGAVAVSIFGIITLNKTATVIAWMFLFSSMVCNWMQESSEKRKYQMKWLLSEKENCDLRWSYIEMGDYIDRMNIPELSDIKLRIDNELNDVEIRKKWFAESHGIKEAMTGDD